MRLHRLEVEGFGPFRERQSVDFDAFADDGIFLIAGRTGAGKSSILDAVCFGLYGGVPRYEGGEKRLRSDHCEPDDISEVVVEFSTTAGRFRVSRSPEYLRPARRGGGMTKQASSVSLEEWAGDSWIGRAARAVDVAGELDEILQLTQSQFLQVILLAQNRFARFLLADSKERQALLRRLFGTERFEDVQSRFEDRRKASENALGARLATVIARVEEAEGVITTSDPQGGRSDDDADAGADLAARGTGTIDERLSALRQALARAEYRAERARAERDTAEQRVADADAALSRAREEQKAQRERDRARAALQLLDEEAPRITAIREELERARAAEGLRATLAAVARAEDALAVAARDEEIARREAGALDVDLSAPTVQELEEWATELTRLSGAWKSVADDEREAPALAAALESAHERVAAATARIDADEVERAELPGLLQEAVAERDALRRIADRRDELQRDRDRADVRRAAVAEQARIDALVKDAERVLAEESTGLATAQASLAALRRRRLDGIAGELAASLVAHEACPVCGSTEHPSPAVHADPVSADDVDEAEAVRDAAIDVERSASERLSVLRAEAAAVAVRTDGRSESSAEAEFVAAAEALGEAGDAAERAAALDMRVSSLSARSEELEAQRTASLTALADAREALVVVEQRTQTAQVRIEDARGGFGSVAERLADASLRIEAARALAGAMAERARRSTALSETARERDAALGASAFDDASAVELALRSPAEQEALESRITAHGVQREKEREILFELELRTLPEESIDLAPVEQASRVARSAWQAVVDAAARAEGLVERLAGLIDSAAQAHERSAAEAAEHEVLRSLADTIAGRGANTHKMTLETFVLAAELEEIVAAANRRLIRMQDGRYQLRHSDALAARGAASGLGIVVHDAFTGQTRPAQSLSGGETFLSSLALALGLAEVVTARAGGIQLDTLFIDEGFGSLDADTLEVAMRALDELRAGGRTVGVISHVEAMQEQIPAQLRVEQTDAGPSRILA
ncbi:AAA family ATPase [Microbacterium tumbae]